MKATCIISLAFPQTKSTNKSTDLVNIESTHSIVTEKNGEKCAGKTALTSVLTTAVCVLPYKPCGFSRGPLNLCIK